MHLLDVNVWLALAFKRHSQHASAVAWFQATTAPCVFCRITQAGFLRLASSPAAMQTAAVSNADAWFAYDQFLADPHVLFADEPTGIEARWRSYTQLATSSPKIWMDAYLAAFAELSGFEVVTFDRAFHQYQNLKSTILR